jgi:thiol-disulfide isomerase/thioredoxin
MRIKFLMMLAIGALLVSSYHACADPATAKDELKEWIARVQTSLRDGKRTEADQADNFKALDALLAKHKGETNDDVAQLALTKAQLYQVVKQPDKATEVLKQLKLDFPDSEQAKQVDQMLANMKKAEESRKIADALVVDSSFPNFEVKDLDDKPLSIAGYKGKVVMVDFWATWCPPCRAEVPNVASVYAKYHDKGFEIIGVSLDKDKDKDKLISFTKEHNMPWRQYFDGKYWQNDLAAKYGIQSIPAAFLLDGNGKIIAKGEDIRGEALEPAVKKALGIN